MRSVSFVLTLFRFALVVEELFLNRSSTAYSDFTNNFDFYEQVPCYNSSFICATISQTQEEAKLIFSNGKIFVFSS